MDIKQHIMPSAKVTECCHALIEKEWTIAFVESATAGRMCSEFALVPDSGKIFLGGIVCYDVSLKENLLDVPSGLIEEHTPESAEVTEALAKNFCKFSGSDICVALTGLLSPGGSETEEKPVGTIFIHIIYPHMASAHRIVFDGSPEEIMIQAIDEVAKVLLAEIRS
jgi:nicotinamide-nucleotide amidase